MQIGTTGVPGTDGTHFDLPSGISVLHNGNLVVTDGYGNNRVVLLDKNGKFIKQVGKGAGAKADKGNGPGEWNLPHQAAVTAEDSIFIVDRENKRIQVFDKDLNYVRQFANAGWNPWDIAIARKGTDRIAAVADHATEQIHVISLDDGKILWTTGKPGQGPGEFDWVHGMAIDSRGAIYAADTYGQRVQKFAPVSPTAGR
jgi:peptidylamidoglycolate lyase